MRTSLFVSSIVLVAVFRITVSNNSSRLSSGGQPSPPGMLTTKEPDVESLVFWVSNGVEGVGRYCRQYSQYYCLDSYRTPSVEYNETLDTEFQNGMNPSATKAWFAVLIKERWQIINMIDHEDPQLCCEAQSMKYLLYGHLRRKMNPEDYMEKLMEYWDEDNKPLNFITAVHLPLVCKNLIVEVGFGPGNLTRNLIPVKYGAPYIILGKEFPGYGIPGVNTTLFDWADPGKILTFHWFKHNIMCKEHPWICGRIEQRTSAETSQTSKKSGRKGSKKNRRKKQHNGS
ncbi:uncharacterized protein LOC142350858 [Convolutriloba macropyga]|uniref:uncharacterized protein LOC142350858 n=1 Tax=Convolutriloba macropyga TaxID=536237 RepID=UPI003F528BA4